MTYCICKSGLITTPSVGTSQRGTTCNGSASRIYKQLMALSSDWQRHDRCAEKVISNEPRRGVYFRYLWLIAKCCLGRFRFWSLMVCVSNHCNGEKKEETRPVHSQNIMMQSRYRRFADCTYYIHFFITVSALRATQHRTASSSQRVCVKAIMVQHTSSTLSS